MTTTAKTKETKPTKEEIAAWKKEHKSVHELVTEDGRTAILRRPKMLDLERALMADKKKGAKPLDFNRVIAKNCLLWSSADFFEDDDRELELYTFAGELAAAGESQTRKL